MKGFLILGIPSFWISLQNGVSWFPTPFDSGLIISPGLERIDILRPSKWVKLNCHLKGENHWCELLFYMKYECCPCCDSI